MQAADTGTANRVPAVFGHAGARTAFTSRHIRTQAGAYRLAAFTLFAAQCFLYRRFTIDDAFITYRHALHLAHGLGPVMNPGERVEGVTSLPWTAAIALFSAPGLEPHRVAPYLSLACGGLCVWLVA